jgi:type VI secretion system secreted protein Hcp
VAVDYFLRIDGIEGESTDAKHVGWIDVDSWSWGATHPAAPAVGAGGGGAGKVQFGDFQFTTRVSKASPKLFLACASGQHIKEARLVGRRTGQGQQDFLTWAFADVLVAAYQTGGAEGGDQPVDSVSLSFGKVTVEYKAQKADGSLDTPVTAGWDGKANKKV